MSYILTVDGRPKCWKRPVSTRHGGVRFNANSAAQAVFGMVCAAQLPGSVPLRVPVRVDLFFYFPRPLHHYDNDGQLRADAPVFYTYPADIDNLCKFALDAMNGYVYDDDIRVMELHAVKRWADGGGGRTTVMVQTL